MNQQYLIYTRILSVLISACLLNLITTRRVFTVIQYSTTLSSLITSFCIIFDICYMMNQQFYIYTRTLRDVILAYCIEFNYFKTRITVIQYSTTLSSLITSFCIIFISATWWTNSTVYIPETPSIDISMLYWI